MTIGWAFFSWYNVVAFPITEGPQWTRGFTANVVLTVCYMALFLVGQVLWRRDIKKGLYKRAIEEEENQEMLDEKLGSDNFTCKDASAANNSDKRPVEEVK